MSVSKSNTVEDSFPRTNSKDLLNCQEVVLQDKVKHTSQKTFTSIAREEAFASLSTICTTERQSEPNGLPLENLDRSLAHSEEIGSQSLILGSNEDALESSASKMESQYSRRQANVSFKKLTQSSSNGTNSKYASFGTEDFREITVDTDPPEKEDRSSKTEESTDSSSLTLPNKKEDVKSQVPMCAAMCVATGLGTPAIVFMGLKLGMAFALGGGMMGFVTGRIFAENE